VIITSPAVPLWCECGVELRLGFTLHSFPSEAGVEVIALKPGIETDRRVLLLATPGRNPPASSGADSTAALNPVGNNPAVASGEIDKAPIVVPFWGGCPENSGGGGRAKGSVKSPAAALPAQGFKVTPAYYGVVMFVHYGMTHSPTAQPESLSRGVVRKRKVKSSHIVEARRCHAWLRLFAWLCCVMRARKAVIVTASTKRGKLSGIMFSFWNSCGIVVGVENTWRMDKHCERKKQV
jgi:hypothetical protein